MKKESSTRIASIDMPGKKFSAFSKNTLPLVSVLTDLRRKAVWVERDRSSSPTMKTCRCSRLTRPNKLDLFGATDKGDNGEGAGTGARARGGGGAPLS